MKTLTLNTINTTKSNTVANLSTLENTVLNEMKLEYAYHVTYNALKRAKKRSRKFIVVNHSFNALKPFMTKDVPHVTRYEIDFIGLLHCAYNSMKLNETMHYAIFNYATSCTLKGAKKVAMLQGNKRDIMQVCDLIETRNTAYASVIEAYNDNQFLQIATDFYKTLSDVRVALDDFKTTTDELTATNDILGEYVIAMRKAISAICYKKLNAYTYQLQRNSRHLDIDAYEEDENGNEIPIIETVLSNHMESLSVKSAIIDIKESMTSKQLEAIKVALNDNHKHMKRYFNNLNKRLHSAPLTSADERFMQRANNKIKEAYHKEV